MMEDTDMRWHCTLQYTIDDDGIWLVYGTDGSERRNLGFYPTVADVLDAAEMMSVPTRPETSA